MAMNDQHLYEHIRLDTTPHTHYELSVKDRSYVPMHWKSSASLKANCWWSSMDAKYSFMPGI